MPRLNSTPVRISNELMTKLKGEAGIAGRTVPAEIEARLLDSLGRGAWGNFEPEVSARALAIGRLVAIVANELIEYSPPGQQDITLKVGLQRLIERMLQGKIEPTAEPIEMIADLKWHRVESAQDKNAQAGQFGKAPDFRALAEIGSALGIKKAEKN